MFVASSYSKFDRFLSIYSSVQFTFCSLTYLFLRVLYTVFFGALLAPLLVGLSFLYGIENDL